MKYIEGTVCLTNEGEVIFCFPVTKGFVGVFLNGDCIHFTCEELHIDKLIFNTKDVDVTVNDKEVILEYKDFIMHGKVWEQGIISSLICGFIKLGKKVLYYSRDISSEEAISLDKKLTQFMKDNQNLFDMLEKYQGSLMEFCKRQKDGCYKCPFVEGSGTCGMRVFKPMDEF